MKVTSVYGRVSGIYCKSGSSEWLGTSFCRVAVNNEQSKRKCPSLMEMCSYKICEDIDQYSTFSMLPRDISQQIFDKMIDSKLLSEVSLEAFRDCALQDFDLQEYARFSDIWMDVISSQGSSLLSVNLSGSDVTDSGLIYIKGCKNLQALNFNYCNQISDQGLDHIRGLSNLTTLCFKRNESITAEGMSAFSGLVNLVILDLERCPGIHGGLVHLIVQPFKGLKKLETLVLNCCFCITDADMEPLSELTNLKGLHISNTKVTDYGVTFFKDLRKLELLNMQGCLVTAECLDYLSALVSLLYLNLNRCLLLNDGCHKFSRLTNLECLDLSFTVVTDEGLKKLSGLSSLKILNLDARQITDAGLAALTNLTGLTHLDLYSARITDAGTNYLCCFKKLRSLEICSGRLTDAGVKNIKDLSCLKLLNISQHRQLTNKSLKLLSGLTELESLNVSDSNITKKGLKHLKTLKKLRSLTLENCNVTDSLYMT